MKIFLFVLTVGLLVGAPVFGAPIVIDAFGTTQTVTAAAGVAPVTATDTIAAGDVLGGFRTIELTRLTGGGATTSTVNLGGNGLFEFNVGAADTATVELTYDGDAADAFDPDGLGPIDLTDGGTNSMFQVLSRSDLGGEPLIITVWSGAGNVAESMFVVPATGFGAAAFTETILNFGSFSTVAGSGADFTNITALRVTVGDGSVPGIDVQLGEIRATFIPEPASLLLTGAGLLALGFLARRRRMS